MTPTFACKDGGRRYRYYVCLNATKRGRHACVSKALSAPVIEELVAQQIHASNRGSAPIDPVPEWASLSLAEQGERFHRLVERIEYDGRDGKLSIRLAAPASLPEGNRANRPGAEPAIIECTLATENRRNRTKLCSSVAAGGRLPRITRLMALAVRFDSLIRRGEVPDYSALARLGHVSRARITQIIDCAS